MMMRLSLWAFIFCAASCIAGCSKGNAIPTVSGTINGQPAVTLYGTTNEPVDYILLYVNGTVKEISYGGVIYNYYTSPANGVYVVISPGYGVAGIMDTVNSKTVISFNTPYNPFASQTYTSR